MTVLILTCQVDLHADAVQVHLDRAGVDWHRIDTARLGSEGHPVTARIDTGGVMGWLGRLALADVTCVWHRRPTEVPGGADDAAELRAGLGGVLSTLPHLNSPVAMAAAHKPRQLALAARCGLLVPATLVTTERADALAFSDVRGGAVVVKPMSRRVAGLIGEADRSGWDRAIHLTQERVSKVYDVRVTVVDGQLFSTVIRSPSLDWRVNLAACAYEPIEPPDPVRHGILGLMSVLRLRYGALDFAVDQIGRWWFLEVNANGQWLWLEEATGQPISAAVAGALAGGERRAGHLARTS
jgi:hypothetical protein